MVADILQVGRTEDSIANGVYQHIGIRMAKCAGMVFQLHPAQDERMPVFQLVHIKTESYFYFHACCFFTVCFLLFLPTVYPCEQQSANRKQEATKHSQIPRYSQMVRILCDLGGYRAGEK